MKRFAVLPALLLFFSIAQLRTSLRYRPSATFPRKQEDARMKALEEQSDARWRSSTLRSELKEFRRNEITGTIFRPQVLLASAHPEPGVLSSSPAPAAAQATQTQTFGGGRATQNSSIRTSA